MRNMANLPLWMVEGLAEYMSIGRVDANTAMWMRDAVLNNKVPRFKDLSNPEYFPYRWGQVFWAFVTGLQGDEIISPLFVATAKYGFEEACLRVLGIKEQELSKLWVSTIKDHYGKFLRDKKENYIGSPLITAKKQGGRMNIAPVLSPNGKYVLFLSEKDLFSIDIFLADAVSGKIIRKVHSSTKSAHLDDLNFIESAGAWSPDSRQFAFVAVKKGENVLVIKDIEGKEVESFIIKGIPAFSNPAWSPDGKSIVLVALVNGQVDLFQVFLRTKKVVQLTSNRFSEMHPAWSADGSKLIFATDQLSTERGNKKWTFNVAVMSMNEGVSGLEVNPGQSERVKILDFFFGADNLNPVFDHEGNILFLSDRDGFRNLYKYESSTGEIFQLSEFLTGISGITPYAPAISASIRETRDRIVFTHYSNGSHSIYRAKASDFKSVPVHPDSVNLEAANLPKINRQASEYVANNLSQINNLPGLEKEDIKSVRFASKFKLDYIGGGGGVGVGVNQGYGSTSTGAAGSVEMLFGDILGDHQVYSAVALNGEIYDLGITTAYLNRKNRLAWGAAFSHTPYSSAYWGYLGVDTLQFNNGVNFLANHFAIDRYRTFEDKLGVFSQFPFSRILRLEGELSYALYYNRVDRYNQYYDGFGNFILEEREKLDPETTGVNLFSGNLGSASIGLVGDNSYFGIASPVKGYRFRVSAERYFGDFNLYDLTLDFRNYTHLRPFTLALRAMHYGRYGKDANNFVDHYLGYPWYLRGFGFGTSRDILAENGRNVNDLVGSKILVSNFEVRVPFTGPEQLSLIKSKFFLTELSIFADAGYAWDVNKASSDPNSNNRTFDFDPLASVGVSLRVNLFGALILEPYYAWPLLKETRAVFGLNIVPGW
jgi:Tol biopolymer transport system component